MLRPATVADFDFMFDLIQRDAKEGHYDRRIHELPGAANGFRLELASILERNVRLNGLIAQPLIKQHDQKPVGFLIMSAGPGNKGNEFWMASIAHQFRGKGYGRAMIEELINPFRGKNKVLFARCSPESEIMFQLLKKLGFRHVETGKAGTRMLLVEL